MKKLIKITSLLSILLLSFSCAYKDQKLDLRLSLEKNNQNSGTSYSEKSDVKVNVIDDRKDKNLGIKQYGDVTTTINSDINLIRLLKRRINDNLEIDTCSKDYKKILEIRITELNYKAKRAFFVGSSEGKAQIKVNLLSSSNKIIFSKNYEFSLTQKHFISSFKSTDKAIIEKLINGVFAEILSDEAMMKSL